MATIPETEAGKRQHIGEDAKRAIEAMRVAVTGSPFVQLRTVVLFLVMAMAMSLAPQPFAALGVAASVVLALEWGRKRGT